MEEYLDKGRGECYLRNERIAAMVQDNFRRYAGERYDLRAWVVMPNHVHLLFKVGSVPMAVTVESWKKHTGRMANEILGRRGAFWAADYFDTFMRDAEHERRTVRYIENNPAKAKHVLGPKEWLWSSARWRDGFGRLRIQESKV